MPTVPPTAMTFLEDSENGRTAWSRAVGSSRESASMTQKSGVRTQVSPTLIASAFLPFSLSMNSRAGWALER